MSQTLPCKALFGDVRGSEIVELVEATTGEACPCKQGRPCPLLPIDSDARPGVIHRAGGSAGAESASDAEPLDSRS